MEYKAEKVTPYGGSESKTGQVRQMFDNIAPAYDFLDHAMTLGIDIRWRRRAAKVVAKHAPGSILDVAVGTGDFAIMLQKRVNPPLGITGIDISAGMLEVAERKIASAGMDGKINFVQGDSLNMPFADGSFGAVTAAFGVRNLERLERGVGEMHRVLAPGGMLCILELSVPTNPVVKALYKLYTRLIIPVGGGVVAKDRQAYAYLPQSIAAMPQGEEMLAMLRRAGFTQCSCRRLTLGVCSLYTAIKPGA